MMGIVLASALFSLGLYGVLTRRDLVAILASVEVMLGGANLLLLVLATTFRFPVAALAARVGAGYALLVLVLGAAEAAVGLALLVALVRRGRARVEDIEELVG